MKLLQPSRLRRSRQRTARSICDGTWWRSSGLTPERGVAARRTLRQAPAAVKAEGFLRLCGGETRSRARRAPVLLLFDRGRSSDRGTQAAGGTDDHRRELQRRCDALRHHHDLLGFLGQHPEARHQGVAVPVVLLGLRHRRPAAVDHPGLHAGQHGRRRTRIHRRSPQAEGRGSGRRSWAASSSTCRTSCSWRHRHRGNGGGFPGGCRAGVRAGCHHDVHGQAGGQRADARDRRGGRDDCHRPRRAGLRDSRHAARRRRPRASRCRSPRGC